MTAFHWSGAPILTHASIVPALVRSSDGASGTETKLVLPLNDRALPYLPRVVHRAAVIVPWLPLPELSAAREPLPCSNPYDAFVPLVPGGVTSRVTGMDFG